MAALTGRPVGVALGTSSVRVVEGIHGWSRAQAAAVLNDSARVTAAALRESRDDLLRAQGFGQRLPPAGGLLTVAAFGDRAIAVAAQHADRMLIDLVSPEQTGQLRAKLDTAARAAGRRPPRLAAWLPAAVDPGEATYSQVLYSIAGYLTVAGYAEMFTVAGFGDAVQLAQAGAGRAELVDALPREAAHTVGPIGHVDTIRARLCAYAGARLDEVAALPVTAADPAGRHTLTTLAQLSQ